MGKITSILRGWFPPDSFGRWMLMGIFKNPLSFAVCLLRSLKATHKLTGKLFPIRVRINPGQKLDIYRSRNVDVVIDGIVRVAPWGGSRLASSITLKNGSKFKIYGDFELGPAVHIVVAKNASLFFGGRRSSTASGITCNTRIMAEKSIDIGSDCIIAWDVFISDSNWHDINGVERCEPISIGDNVWIAHGASVGKGARIPAGCIVGAKSLVTRGVFPEKSLLVGVPAAVRRTNVEWSR